MKYHVYKDNKGEWRWTLRSRNGRVVADSAEGYQRKGKCVDEIARIQVGGFPVIVANE